MQEASLRNGEERKVYAVLPRFFYNYTYIVTGVMHKMAEGFEIFIVVALTFLCVFLLFVAGQFAYQGLMRSAEEIQARTERENKAWLERYTPKYDRYADLIQQNIDLWVNEIICEESTRAGDRETVRDIIVRNLEPYIRWCHYEWTAQLREDFKALREAVRTQQPCPRETLWKAYTDRMSRIYEHASQANIAEADVICRILSA